MEVPLHARYPHPVLPPPMTEATAPAGAGLWIHLRTFWQQAAGGPSAAVPLPRPQLLLRCGLAGGRQAPGEGWQQVAVAPSEAAVLLVWEVPAGNLRHAAWAGPATAAAVLAGAAAVLAGALCL